MKIKSFLAIIAITMFSACHNQPWEFPDFDYTTVYFAYQSPVRTIILGDDVYDNSLDNEHKCLIMASMGGVYENKNDITVDVVVDNTLCDSLRFGTEEGDHVIALPANYYSLASDMKIVIPKGKVMGGIEVQLTDAFFADTLSLKNTYVIPLRITSVVNADSILQGKSDLESPDSRVAADWETAPKDYILYAVKYINQWHGNYLRRGQTLVTGKNGNSGLDTTIVYREKYIEWDQVVSSVSKAYKSNSIPLNTRVRGDRTNMPFDLRLNFDDNGKCTVSSVADSVYTVSGSGEFVLKGDMWGNEKRDVLYLNYTVDFESSTHVFSDTLVMRDRGIAFETFTPVVIR
jgi:hypothetical protein